MARFPINWSRLTRGMLRTTPRGAAEFAVAVAAFVTCDPTPVSLIAGAGACALGEIIRVTAAGYGYNVGELSLQGPYRFVRHPYFLGSSLLFLGLCVAGRNAYVVGAAAVLLTLVYRASYRQDEQRLATRLGPRFADYRERVPAFIPQLYPAPALPADSRAFSLEYALLRGRHRELDATVGLGIAFGVLYLGYWTAAKDLFHLGVAVAVALYLASRFLYYGALRRS